MTEVIGLGVLTRLIDRDTVDEVLAKADRRETRVRLLPARVVVYLVLALCLFTADGYDEVVRKLTNGLRGLRIWQDDWKVPTPSAISQARTRLGSGVMAELFKRVCVPVAKRARVLAYGTDAGLPTRRGGAASGIVPLAFPDADEVGVLGVLAS